MTSAVCASDAWDEHILRDAAMAVGRAQGGGAYGLAVVRQDEIVGVAQVPRSGAEAAVANLRRACADLQPRHVRLAVGVSTVHCGLHEVPEAYAEARVARDSLGSSAGVLALPLLSSFDYLVLREDETARPGTCGRRTDRHSGRVRRVRPQRQDRCEAAAPARQHGLLPAGANR